MAVFNGDQFLKRQLDSILVQLSENDEIVIVDDASNDETIAVVESFHDSRIHVMRNAINIGPLKSFERALAEAKGDYIFFADQDDYWLPNKVETVVASFVNSKALAIVTDAKVVNSREDLVYESYSQWRNSGPGLLKNFYKNTFLGCCMAIRKECKEFLLPFPPFAYMHDRWIGLACTAVGTVSFLPQQLLIYHRHEKTVTKMQRSGVGQIIKLRFFLFLSLLSASPRLLYWRKKYSAAA
ncbi:MAG: glycosyltransferase [Desulfuromonadales bacterium]|nr:glycosyltransferase [Desulfuromonadales bacterium]